jgi:ABC-type Na+ efflux pump permease subunit
MRIERIKTIAAKELRDVQRDRRTLLAMIVIPMLILPILMFLPMFLANPQRNPLRVAIAQADQTSDDFLENLSSDQMRMVQIRKEENLTELIQNGDYELGMSLPQDFSRIFTGLDQTATITIFVDQTNTRGMIALTVVQNAITGYANRIVSERLTKTGLPLETLNPIKTEVRAVTVGGTGPILLTIVLPLFLGIYAVTGGMYFIMDTTAGEKERKTLEALLTMPATRTEIVLGKFLIAVLIAVLSSIFAVLGMSTGAVFLLGSVGGYAGQSISISIFNLLLIGAATLVLAMTTASLEMMISIFARNFKEAQNFLSPLTIMIAIPAITMQYMSEHTLRFFAIAPIFNAMLIIRDALQNRVSAVDLSLQFTSALFYMVIALSISIKVFSNEKVMVRY